MLLLGECSSGCDRARRMLLCNPAALACRTMAACMLAAEPALPANKQP